MENLTFTNNGLPNFHLEINSRGVKVWVSLNIEPAMKRHLSPNNVFKADKHWTYCLRKQLDVVSLNTVNSTHEELLTRAMILCREAKKKVLDEQITNLKNSNR